MAGRMRWSTQSRENEADIIMRVPSHPAFGEPPMVQAYCVKCRKKRDMVNPTKVTLKNGKPAMKGKCPVCGTSLFRIGAV